MGIGSNINLNNNNETGSTTSSQKTSTINIRNLESIKKQTEIATDLYEH